MRWSWSYLHAFKLHISLKRRHQPKIKNPTIHLKRGRRRTRSSGLLTIVILELVMGLCGIQVGILRGSVYMHTRHWTSWRQHFQHSTSTDQSICFCREKIRYYMTNYFCKFSFQNLYRRFLSNGLSFVPGSASSAEPSLIVVQAMADRRVLVSQIKSLNSSVDHA